MKFEWDAAKEARNIAKHGVDFTEAEEARFYCIGRTGRGVLTVRFTYRSGDIIRIFGAGYWRKGRRLYEKRES